MLSSHFSFSSPSLLPFLSVPPLSHRKCRSIFHLLHGLGCDQKFQFIVGREYNYAYFQLLSFSLLQRGTVMYLCCGPKKLNKVNITPTCCRLWSPSLWVSNSFLWSVSPVLHAHDHYLKLSWEAYSIWVPKWSVFNQQTQWTLLSCFYELEFFGVNMSESWNSSLSQVLVSIVVTNFCECVSRLFKMSSLHTCMHALHRALTYFIIKVSFLAICCL